MVVPPNHPFLIGYSLQTIHFGVALFLENTHLHAKDPFGILNPPTCTAHPKCCSTISSRFLCGDMPIL